MDTVLKHMCDCGSKHPRQPLHDARGIFVAYVCQRCKADKMSDFRPEIFTDPNYSVDEPVEPDDGIDWYALSNGLTTVMPCGTIVHGTDE